MQDATKLFYLSQQNLTDFANSILKNLEDAQDVVQEVFKECIEKQVVDVNRPYLFKAVRNRALNRIRFYNRFNTAIQRFGDYLNLFENEHSDEELSVFDHLDSLPKKQKEVLILRIKAELTISEIAEVLTVPEGTVKSRINKAILNLKEQVKEY